MILLATILLLVALVCVIKYVRTLPYDAEVWGGLAALLGVLGFICLLAAINIQLGTKQLTGYIYSSNDRVGYTTAHIRFSENAGTDKQPSFCVASGSDVGQQIQELTGSGKKVKVTIPPFFYMSNNPFACGTTETTIVEVK